MNLEQAKTSHESPAMNPKKKWVKPQMEVLKVNSGIVILPIEIMGIQGPS
ncbi:hypothetical protein [Emticicia fluvialis]|nr:hypothetical protein [Emticicia fluvialis]